MSDQEHPGEPPRARSIKDGPWIWAAKAALDRLQDVIGEGADGASPARSVYLALCQLASDAGSETVTATKALIAYRAGLSIRTVQRVLPDLERAGILAIIRSAAGLRTASTYTLLFVPNSHGVSTSGHGVSTIGHGRRKGQLADKVKEQKKEQKKEPEKNIAPAKPSQSESQPDLIEVPAEAAKQTPKSRPRDELFDGLASACGSDARQMTTDEARACGVALAKIKAACPGVTAQEIQRRVGNLRTHWPEITITPSTLARHWSRGDKPKPAPPKKFMEPDRKFDRF